MHKRKIHRGDIYYADLDPVVGSEQGGVRPILVIQNDTGNEHSPTIIAMPFTRTMRKNPLPTHVMIPNSYGLDGDSLALAEQIRTIDRHRLSDYVGRIDDGDVWREIDKALAIAIDLWRRES